MKLSILIFSMALIIFSCSRAEKDNIVSSENDTTTYKQEDKLIEAYKQNSNTLLNSFFEEWLRESTNSRRMDQHLNDVEKTAYEVFESFYTPRQLSKIGGNETNSELYKDIKFFITPSYIKVAKVKSLNRDSVLKIKLLKLVDSGKPERLRVNGKFTPEALRYLGNWIKSTEVDTLRNFSPDIENSLHLSNDYELILNEFLGNQISSKGNNVMNPAMPVGESFARVKFLGNHIKIWPGHWRGWHLETFPIVYRITLDKELRKAVVTYRMVYESGETFMMKENGKWVIIDNRRTGIE